MHANKNTWILILTGLIISLASIATTLLDITAFMYTFFPVLVGLLFALSYDGRNSLRLLGSSFFIALILSIPFIGNGHEVPRQISLAVFYPLLVYLIHCFHYTYHHNGNQWSINYTQLFEAGWNTLVVLLIAGLFVFTSIVLIFCASFLFNSMGSPLLYNLMFHTVYFPGFWGMLLIFIGIAIAQNNIKALNQLRFTLLTSMYYFLPFLVFTSVVFFIMFWKNTSQNPNVIISAFIDLIILSILFLNAYYQDGNEEQKRMAWLNALLRGYKVLLLVMILIASYYAFTYMSLEFNQVIYLTAILFLGWIYAYSAFFSDQKAQQIIEYGNKHLAIAFIVALYVAILPFSYVNFTVNKGKPPLSIGDGTDYIRKYGPHS